jgi:pSer/pThr/pTyr-binding forkhead associated (FHA) protein
MGSGRTTDRHRRPQAGSLGQVLGSIARTLAGMSAASFDTIVPEPVLLVIETSDEPMSAGGRLDLLRVHQDLLEANVHFLEQRGGARLQIGRSANTCDLVLPHETVSRVHAELDYRTDHWRIEDAGSKFGTRVNGKLCGEGTPRILKGGEVLRLGEVTAVFLLPEHLRGLVKSSQGEVDATHEEEPLPSSQAPSLRLPAEGILLRDFVTMARDGIFNVEEGDQPYLLQIPVLSPGANQPTKAPQGPEQTGSDDGEHDMAATIKISAEVLENLQRSRDVAKARIHCLVPGEEDRHVIIGRGEGCQVVLPETSVSKQHAVLYCGRDRCWRVMDMGSRNGTYVNGGRLPPHLRRPLPEGHEQLWFAAYRAAFLTADSVRKLVKNLK